MQEIQPIPLAVLTDLDLRPLRCLVCGCSADGNTMRVTLAEDGCWLAICDDCCEFFGKVLSGLWLRRSRLVGPP